MRLGWELGGGRQGDRLGLLEEGMIMNTIDDCDSCGMNWIDEFKQPCPSFCLSTCKKDKRETVHGARPHNLVLLMPLNKTRFLSFSQFFLYPPYMCMNISCTIGKSPNHEPLGNGVYHVGKLEKRGYTVLLLSRITMFCIWWLSGVEQTCQGLPRYRMDYIGSRSAIWHCCEAVEHTFYLALIRLHHSCVDC